MNDSTPSSSQFKRKKGDCHVNLCDAAPNTASFRDLTFPDTPQESTLRLQCMPRLSGLPAAPLISTAAQPEFDSMRGHVENSEIAGLKALATLSAPFSISNVNLCGRPTFGLLRCFGSTGESACRTFVRCDGIEAALLALDLASSKNPKRPYRDSAAVDARRAHFHGFGWGRSFTHFGR